MLEKLVLSKVSSYLNSHNLYNTCQSAYSICRSIEAALLKVADDQFFFLNKGCISVLSLHDFSSAFEAIDHPIIVLTLDLLILYINGLHLIRLIVRTTSAYLIISLLLLQCTKVFLGYQFLALSFSPCILSLCLPLSTHTIIHHSFADDIQLQTSAPPENIL